MIFRSDTGLKLHWPSPFLIISIFSILALVTLRHHALWRDEFNPWLIVRDSSSWLDLWQNIRYEGHPVLWYLCLSAFHHLTHTVVSIQIFHLALGIASIALFWRYSPFRPLEKLLFTFGYFPFFEYLILSRNYSLGMFFSFLFCSLFSTRKYSYLPLALVLGLMANSHAYALMIAISLGLMLGLEWVCDREHRKQFLARSSHWDLLISVGLLLGLCGLAAYVIAPPSNSYLHGGDQVMLEFDLRRLLIALGRISGAYVHVIPNSKRWLDLMLTDLLVLIFVSLVSLKLSRKPWVLFFYGFSTALITFTFFYLKQEELRGLRHFGSLYVVLITSLWLASRYPESPRLTQWLKISPELIRVANQAVKPIFMAILVCHCAMGLYRVGQEYFLPFSASRATTQYMQAAGLYDEFILASPDAMMAPIAGYLNRQLYYPEIRGWGSFTLFREGRTLVEQPRILNQAMALLRGEAMATSAVPARILLVLNHPLDPMPADSVASHLVITPVAQFQRSYINTEQYYLYWLSLHSAEQHRVSSG
jgi:hypothetical protein